METAVCNTSAEKIQDQALSLELKGLLFSDESFSTANASSVQSENLELNLKGKTNRSVSGLIKVDSEIGSSCESPKPVESPQKSLSPTLIEHAFKVMKNLFSPDKTRSKPVNIPSPITRRSSSGSPVSSIFIPNRAEFCTPESGIEIKNIVQSAENSVKGDSSLTQLGIMHNSFGLDPLNNTNDSFFTTTSLIDESFQSAITHLDENTDTLNTDENKEKFLNDSRVLDSLDPLSETLDNSEHCLEDTILMNDGLSSDRAEPGSVFGDEMKGNLKSPDYVQETSNSSNGLSKKSLNVSSEKNSENPSVEPHELPSASDEKQVKESERKEKVEVSMSNLNEAEEPSQNTKTEIMSSDEPHKENISSEPSKSNKCFSSRSEEERRENSDVPEMKISEEVIGDDNELCDGRESSVEKSISTTTVILNAMDSVYIDNMLLSLKEDDSGTNTSSLTSVEGNDESGSVSLDHDFNRQPDSALADVVSSNLNGDRPESNFDDNFLSKRPPGRIKSKSEENSPNKSNSARKNKLNKSIDFVRRRSRSKSPEGKKAPIEKLSSRSSEVVSTEKNGEVPENFSDFKPPMGALNIEVASKVPTNLNSSSLNVDKNKTDEVLGKFIALDVEKSIVTQDEADSVSVVGQQSYTILIAADKNLNRPVINSSERLSNGLPKNCLPYVEEMSNGNAPAVTGEDKVVAHENNYLSVSAENVNLLPTTKSFALSYEMKSNSNLLKTPQKSSTQNFAKPGLLNLYHQEIKNSTDGDKGVDFNEFQDSSFQSKPELNGKPAELSPVTPLGNQVLFSNEINQAMEKKVKSSTPNKPSLPQKKIESPAHGKLNQTYEKKAGSPTPSKMNQTFDKKQETPVQNKLNQTYEKKTETTPTVKLNLTYEKKFECSLGRLNQGEPASPTPPKFNETFDKKAESPSILSKTFEIVEAGGQDEKNKTFEIKSSSPAGNSFDKTFEKDQKLGGESFILSRISEVHPALARSPETRLASVAENFIEKASENVVEGEIKDTLDASFISTTSSNASLLCNANSTVVFNQGPTRGLIDDLAAKMQEMNLSESTKKEREIERWAARLMPPPQIKKIQEPFKDQTIFIERKLLPNYKDEKVQCDAELVQLIQEQFSSTDIEKICSVVDDLSFLRLSSQKAHEQFENLSAAEFNPLSMEFKCAALSPQSFDFLNSIKGKPTGRDLSRESLYVKFDPLVQAPSANSLIDFTKEVEALAASEVSPETEPRAGICEQLLNISPEKKPDEIVPPLTPLSHKKKEDKAERLKELQNEIYFCRNLYAEREKLNKAKMEEFESQVTKLTGQNCMLEDKLKESNEREKSLVKKLKEETQSMNQLKAVMEEYVKMITKLTVELQELKLENAKQVEALIYEKDSYVTHLQNTEAAFTDVHAKYEKSKKTILNLKANEAAYKSTIAEKTRLLENLREKAKEAQEMTFLEFQKIQEELSETKAEHRQETARLRALLRKTELKLEAMQESLDHKIKENEQLTVICDELIEGKK